jgi:hypothetical protein
VRAVRGAAVLAASLAAALTTGCAPSAEHARSTAPQPSRHVTGHAVGLDLRPGLGSGLRVEPLSPATNGALAGTIVLPIARADVISRTVRGPITSAGGVRISAPGAAGRSVELRRLHVDTRTGRISGTARGHRVQLLAFSARAVRSAPPDAGSIRSRAIGLRVAPGLAALLGPYASRGAAAGTLVINLGTSA